MGLSLCAMYSTSITLSFTLSILSIIIHKIIPIAWYYWTNEISGRRLRKLRLTKCARLDPQNYFGTMIPGGWY